MFGLNNARLDISLLFFKQFSNRHNYFGLVGRLTQERILEEVVIIKNSPLTWLQYKALTDH